MTTQALNDLADKVVIANATGNETLYNGAVSELLTAVRALATVSDEPELFKTSKDEQASSWMAVYDLMSELVPDLPVLGDSGEACVLAAIRRLATVSDAQPIGWIRPEVAETLKDQRTASDVEAVVLRKGRGTFHTLAIYEHPAPDVRPSVPVSDERIADKLLENAHAIATLKEYSVDKAKQFVRTIIEVASQPAAPVQQEPVAIDIELVEDPVYGGLHIRHWKARAPIQTGKYTLYAAPVIQAAPSVPDARQIWREPTDAMQAAGAQAIRFDTTILNKIWTANAVFRAMWDAATPSAPSVSADKPDADSTGNQAQDERALHDQWFTREYGGIGMVPKGEYRMSVEGWKARATATTASVSADATDQMDIDREGARFWHRNCTNHLGGVMKVIKDEPTQSLIQCLHCGKSGYYPVGGVGRIRAAIAGQSKEPKGAGE